MNTEIHAFLKAELDRTMESMVDENIEPTCQRYVSKSFNFEDSPFKKVQNAVHWLIGLKSKKVSKHAKCSAIEKGGGFMMVICDPADIENTDVAINGGSSHIQSPTDSVVK